MNRDELLRLLVQEETGFVSGQEISNRLGISRTAVWKQIEELRKSGYEVEAVPRKGYRLLHRPNMVTSEEIKSRLETEHLGQHVIYNEEVTSTQDLAHEQAQKSAPEGTIVVADRQTKGKGRLGRVWHSPPEHGLWTSLILRPNIPPYKAPQLTLLTAVAVAEGAGNLTGAEAEIKWPNDVLLNGKKLCGILTEMQSEADMIHAIIVGIGMNVNQQVQDFPEELKGIATSLRLEYGAPFRRADVLKEILERFEYWYQRFLTEGFEPVRNQWEVYALSFGRRIKARTIQGTIYGIAKGITADGVLLLEDDEGKTQQIYSADIEIQ
ncbi:biotin--[acetyl-CoA-carboxylase] ligase [Salsuginibacillus kocurii]|uniref:biotin--[acetyl-CoA-carboxylase] ligase n=1 Tax=Salsuginibacillus kocurii TaxID=427078 RepID=UPI0003727342|nr:biotin--[acetyl-CoA-carboxylase] ligase [Salsuginibacillus kocurii]